MPFPHLLPDSRHNAVQSLATEPCYQGVCSAVQCVQERENLQTLCYIKEATRKTHTKENQRFLTSGLQKPFAKITTYTFSSIHKSPCLSLNSMWINGLYILLWRRVKTEMNFGMQYQGYSLLILETSLYMLFSKRPIFH